jgi:hypothetical protein
MSNKLNPKRLFEFSKRKRWAVDTEMHQENWHVYPPKPHWQITVIANNFVHEVDCNSGKYRRVYKTGEIQYLKRHY